MTVYQRIKERRQTLGMSQQNLADLMGYKTRGAINKIEMGLRDINQTKIEAFATALKTTSAYLMGWDEEAPNSKFDTVQIFRIPIVGHVSAGIGCLAQEDIEGYDIYSKEDINPNENYISLRVDGDSMQPKICEGDRVLVHIQPSIDSGRYAVVVIDNENGVVKKVEYTANSITLISENPYYPPRKFIGAEVQRISVIGLVTKVVRDL